MKLRRLFCPDRYQKHVSGAWVEITAEEYHRLAPSKPPDYRRGECAWTHGDFGDWSQENGGKGRFLGFLARHARDAGGYCRSAADAIDRCKERPDLGLNLQRDRL